MKPNPITFSSDSCRRGVTSTRSGTRAFTLIEMLVVLVIIGIIAALALPNIRGNSEAVAAKAAAYQVVEDLSWARQKAISQRGTVAVVFLTDAILDNSLNWSSLPTNAAGQVQRLRAGIFTHYAVFGFRKVGEQPGRGTPGFLTEWKALPEKTFFPVKNSITDMRPEAFKAFPFPFTGSPVQVRLPYIAFDHEGRVVLIEDMNTGRGTPYPGPEDGITNAIARGAVFYGRDANGDVTGFELQEIPRGNGTNNLFVVDVVTGRAKREEAGVQ